MQILEILKNYWYIILIAIFIVSGFAITYNYQKRKNKTNKENLHNQDSNDIPNNK